LLLCRDVSFAFPEAQERHRTDLNYQGGRGRLREATDVRFGSKADMCAAKGHVRFTPNSDRESGHRQTVMSALPPKADMCGAQPLLPATPPKADMSGPLADIRFGPIADIVPFIRSPCRRARGATAGSPHRELLRSSS